MLKHAKLPEVNCTDVLSQNQDLSPFTCDASLGLLQNDNCLEYARIKSLVTAVNNHKWIQRLQSQFL